MESSQADVPNAFIPEVYEQFNVVVLKIYNQYHTGEALAIFAGKHMDSFVKV